MVSTLTQRSLLYCRILRAIYLNCTSGTRPPNFLLPLVQNSETTRSPILSEPLGRRATARLEKSLCLCLAGLRIRRFDPIAEASELPDHFPSAPLLRLFGDSWASFFVTDSLVQDQPNQPTLPMGNRPDGLIMSQARDGAAIDNFEDASFGPGCGISGLIE